MPALYLKLAGAAAILLLVAGALGWLYHRGYAAGEARVHAAEVKAAQIQQAKDQKTAQETTDGLKSDLAQARELANRPVPPGPVRLLYVPRSCPAAPAPPGGQPGAPTSGSLPGVSESDRGGPDPLPSLRHLAEAGEVVAAEGRACLRWARGIAKP